MEFQTDEKIMTASVEMVVKNDVLYIRVLEGAELNQESIIVNTLVLEKFLGEKKFPVLVDASANFTVQAQGLDYWASERANRNREAVAIFSKGERVKVLSEILMKIPGRHAVPVQIFSSKKEGLHWLESLRGRSSGIAS